MSHNNFAIGDQNPPLEAGVGFSWPVRIYYEDTDAGGVVYHANYLRFMERCRTEWLRTIGQSVECLAENYGKVFVVTGVTMDFKRPAVLGDLLGVTASLVTTRRASMVVQQEVKRGDQLLVSAEIHLAMVDMKRFRPTAIPEPLLTLLL